MSNFIDDNHVEEEWKTVSSKSSKNRSKTYDVLECNLNDPSIRSPEPGPGDQYPQNKEVVGQYLMSYEKGIYRESMNQVRRLPAQYFQSPPHDKLKNFKIKQEMPNRNPFEKFEPFSLAPTFAGLYSPTEVMPNTDIVVGRGCLKKFLQLFDFNATSKHNLRAFEFRLRITEDHIDTIPYRVLQIEDCEKWNASPGYGYGFESAMTVTRVNNRDEKNAYFYRIIRYNLDNLRLLVGFEVDCVRGIEGCAPEQYPSVELKTCSDRYEPDWLSYWYQLATSDTKFLCVGSIDKTSGHVRRLVYKQETELLPEDSEPRTMRFSQLTKLLQWIRATMERYPSGREARLAFDPHSPYKLAFKIETE
jgi:hypothetical protein